jgi:hypothetical protein
MLAAMGRPETVTRLLAALFVGMSLHGCDRPAPSPAAVPVAVEVASVPTAVPAANEAAVVTTVAAADAVLAGRLLFVLEPGFSTVRAIDAITGKALWRTPLPAHGRGVHLLQRLGDRLLARTGEGLTVIDARGAIVAHHAVALGDRTFLWRRDEACGLRGDCSFQLIDCSDARPIGNPIAGAMRHRRSFDGEEMHSGCWGFDVDLWGRFGGALLVIADGAEPEGARAIDVASGQIRWHQPAVGCHGCPDPLRGLASDLAGAASDDEVVALDAASGRIRWRHPAEGATMALWVDGGGIFVTTPTAASLLEPATGKPRWSQPLAGERAMVQSARLPEGADIWLRTDRDMPLLWLDERGASLGRSTLKAGQTLIRTAGAAEVTIVDGLSRDRAGQLVEGAAAPMVAVERSRRSDSGSGPPNQAVVRRVDGEIVMTIASDAWSLGEAVDADRRTAAIYVSRGDARPDEVRLLRLR